jgi:hypothetical protein
MIGTSRLARRSGASCAVQCTQRRDRARLRAVREGDRRIDSEPEIAVEAGLRACRIGEGRIDCRSANRVFGKEILSRDERCARLDCGLHTRLCESRFRNSPYALLPNRSARINAYNRTLACESRSDRSLRRSFDVPSSSTVGPSPATRTRNESRFCVKRPAQGSLTYLLGYFIRQSCLSMQKRTEAHIRGPRRWHGYREDRGYAR